MWLAIISSCNKVYPSVYNVYVELNDLIEFMDKNLVITKNNIFLNSNDDYQNDSNDDSNHSDNSDDSDDSDVVPGPIIHMSIGKYEHYEIKNYDKFDGKEYLENHFEYCNTSCRPIITIIEMDSSHTVCKIMDSVQCL